MSKINHCPVLSGCHCKPGVSIHTTTASTCGSVLLEEGVGCRNAVDPIREQVAVVVEGLRDRAGHLSCKSIHISIRSSPLNVIIPFKTVQ